MKTPNINSYGIYSISPPWDIPLIPLNCIKIEQIATKHYDLVYAPNRVSVETFSKDLLANRNIVTLVTATGGVYTVPDSFIINFPDEVSVPYSNILLSIELGELPDKVLLEDLQREITELTAGYIGKDKPTRIHASPLMRPVSYADHTLRERTRVESYDSPVSTKRSLSIADSTINSLKDQILRLEEIIRTQHDRYNILES